MAGYSIDSSDSVFDNQINTFGSKCLSKEWNSISVIPGKVMILNKKDIYILISRLVPGRPLPNYRPFFMK
jgi:hypothetical protein